MYSEFWVKAAFMLGMATGMIVDYFGWKLGLIHGKSRK